MTGHKIWGKSIKRGDWKITHLSPLIWRISSGETPRPLYHTQLSYFYAERIFYGQEYKEAKNPVRQKSLLHKTSFLTYKTFPGLAGAVESTWVWEFRAWSSDPNYDSDRMASFLWSLDQKAKKSGAAKANQRDFCRKRRKLCLEEWKQFREEGGSAQQSWQKEQDTIQETEATGRYIRKSSSRSIQVTVHSREAGSCQGMQGL